MIKTQTLYINIDSMNPQSALVRGNGNTQPTSMGSIVAGDTARYVIYAVDSTGVTSSISGNTDYQVKVALGGLGDGPLAQSTNFVSSGSAWTGSLDTNTGSLLTPLGTTDTLNVFFEVELVVTASVFDTGSHYTILQAPITIRNQVIPNS